MSIECDHTIYERNWQENLMASRTEEQGEWVDNRYSAYVDSLDEKSATCSRCGHVIYYGGSENG